MTPMLHGRLLEGAASSRARAGLTADWVQPHFDPMTKAVMEGAGWARAEPAYLEQKRLVVSDHQRVLPGDAPTWT